MADKQSIWARDAFHSLIVRTVDENGQVLSEGDAAPFQANVEALKALCGFSDTPAAQIATLLRSAHPIAPEVREALARALEGASPIRLEVTGLSYSKAWRSLRRARNAVQRGRSAISLMEKMGYDGAINHIAGQDGKDVKTVAADVALVRKIDAWIERKRKEDPFLAWLTYSDLEYSYLVSMLAKKDHDAILKAVLSNIYTENLPIDAEGFRKAIDAEVKRP